VEVALQAETGDEVEMSAGETLDIPLWTLHTLVLTLPITECFRLTLEVRVNGRLWDNQQQQTLQPMSRLVFRTDDAAFSLVGAGMFRATVAGEHTIEVVYGDETLESPLLLRYRLIARP
jgi:hypothetical protein